MSGLPTWMQDNIAAAKKTVPGWLAQSIDRRDDGVQIWLWLASVQADPGRRMKFPKLDQLELLAYDIADMLDRNDWGMGEISETDIRPTLTSFIVSALAHAAGAS
jgi:hypothetical protein